MKFAAYRQYLDQRQLVNSAVMALLAGSQLAMHTLQLTEGSNRTMSEIFPRVPHIDQFNLKTEVANEFLGQAESHLSAMAIPYIITIQESLFGTFESMLMSSGATLKRKSKMTSPVWIVKEYWEATGQTLDEPSWLVFELLNELRHDITHRAGIVGPNLMTKASLLTKQAISLWERMANKSFPSFLLGQKHVLDHADMVVCLAVVKFLAREGNVIMQGCYPRDKWLADLVQDVTATRGLSGNLVLKTRTTQAFARLNYAPLRFSKPEVEAEIRGW